MVTKSAADRLKKLIQKDPDISGEDAAKKLGVSKQRIYQIAKQAGFKRLWSVGS